MVALTLDIQERVTELESKLTFQEATSDSLSEVIVALEGRLEVLEKRLRLVEARGSGGSDGEEPDPLNERPPHY
ncbi:MAG TPA: SlyX family protein [Planctomycetes bacterium]|nr:SlyX family protein [Planctomycetota bacterium]